MRHGATGESCMTFTKAFQGQQENYGAKQVTDYRGELDGNATRGHRIMDDELFLADFINKRCSADQICSKDMFVSGHTLEDTEAKVNISNSKSFVVLHLSSFTFYLDKESDETGKDKIHSTTEIKLSKKVNECVHAGMKSRLGGTKRSYILLEINTNGKLNIWNKKKKLRYNHCLSDIQLWKHKDFRYCCFAVVARSHGKASEGKDGSTDEHTQTWRGFMGSGRNRMTFISHVFMTDPSLAVHDSHRAIAGAFGINCHFDLTSETCYEFPNSCEDVIARFKTQFGFKSVSDLAFHNEVYSAKGYVDDIFQTSSNITNSSHCFKLSSTLDMFKQDLETTNQGMHRSRALKNQDEKSQSETSVPVLEVPPSSQIFYQFFTREQGHSCRGDEEAKISSQSLKPPVPFKRSCKNNRTPFSAVRVYKGQDEAERCVSTPPILNTVSEEEEDFIDNIGRLNRLRKEDHDVLLRDEKKYFYESDSGLDAVRQSSKKCCNVKQNEVGDYNEDIGNAKTILSRKNSIACANHRPSLLSKSAERRRISGFIKQVATSRIMFNKSSSKESVASADSDSPSSSSLPQSDGDLQREARTSGWAVSFEKLFSDTSGLALFTEFLRIEFSLENMKFWKKCEEYKRLFDVQRRKQQAQNIYFDHFAPGAIDPINVDHDISIHVRKGLASAPPDLFDQAQKHIYLLMKQDIYPRFKRSDLYKNALMAELEGRPYLVSGMDLFKDLDYQEKITKGGKSSLFWHKTKLPKTSTNPDMRSISRDCNDIQRSQSPSHQKFSVNLPDGRSIIISTENFLAFQLTLKEVLLWHQDKIKPGLIFYEAIDPLTGQHISLDEQLGSLNCSKLEMVRCAVFRVDFVQLHKSIIVKVRRGISLRDCLEPIFTKYCMDIDHQVFELASSDCQLSTDTTVDVLDCQHVVAKCNCQSNRMIPLELSSSKNPFVKNRMSDTFNILGLSNLDHITFDRHGVHEIEKPKYAEFGVQRCLKHSDAQGNCKRRLLGFIKRNTSERKKPRSFSHLRTNRDFSKNAPAISRFVKIETKEPQFDDDTLLDLIQKSHSRTIDTQCHGALHKTMPKFLMEENTILE